MAQHMIQHDMDDTRIRRLERSYEAEIDRLRTQKTQIAAVVQMTDAGPVRLSIITVEETFDGLYIEVQ